MSVSLRFRMNLSEFPTSELMLGHLSVLENDDERASYRVTSGLPSFQFKGSEAKVARGPIPRCRFADLDTFRVQTSPLDRTNTPGIEGTFYLIEPLSVKVHDELSGLKATRGEFGIHFDHNVPGSAGCIVFRKMADYKEYESLMTRLRKSQVTVVPLHVDYNLHERSWKVVVNGVRFGTFESVNGTLLVPIRAFADLFLDATVGFDADSRRVTLNQAPIQHVSFIRGVAFAPLRALCTILKQELFVEDSVSEVRVG